MHGPECGREEGAGNAALLELPSPLGPAFVSLACSRCGEFQKQKSPPNKEFRGEEGTPTPHHRRAVAAVELSLRTHALTPMRLYLRCVRRAVRFVRLDASASLALPRQRVRYRKPPRVCANSDEYRGELRAVRRRECRGRRPASPLRAPAHRGSERHARGGGASRTVRA
jgi:hypothetical protein